MRAARKDVHFAVVGTAYLRQHAELVMFVDVSAAKSDAQAKSLSYRSSDSSTQLWFRFHTGDTVPYTGTVCTGSRQGRAPGVCTYAVLYVHECARIEN